MEKIDVLMPGTPVEIGVPGDRFDATIIAVLIETAYRVSYKVAWYDGRQRKEEWLVSEEILATRGSERVTARFFNTVE